MWRLRKRRRKGGHQGTEPAATAEAERQKKEHEEAKRVPVVEAEKKLNVQEERERLGGNDLDWQVLSTDPTSPKVSPTFGRCSQLTVYRATLYHLFPRTKSVHQKVLRRRAEPLHLTREAVPPSPAMWRESRCMCYSLCSHA